MNMSLKPVEQAESYLGEGCSTPYSAADNLGRWTWSFVQSTVFRWSPRPWHGFRARLLRLFGARIDDPSKVVIFPTATVTFPWKLRLDDRSMVGPRVNLYNLAPITLEYGANISQNCHLCAGTHDYERWSMPLVAKPIVIRRNAWVAADSFIGPGVTVGELCVVGARSVVVKDLPARTVCAGNPCRPVKERPEPRSE